MGKEYVAYVRDPQQVPQGQEMLLVVRDLTPGSRKYDARVVKAILSETAPGSKKSDIIFLRSGTGILDPKPRGIKIVKEMGTSLPGPPYSDVLAMQE
jgi:hypothetical protein